MQHWGRDNPLVARRLLLAQSETNLSVIHATCDKTIAQGSNKFVATRPSVTTKDDARFDRGVDLERLYQTFEGADKLLGIRRVADLGGMNLPGGLEHLSTRVDELDAVVRCWVVRGSDHDTDRSSLKLLGPENRNETQAEESCRKVMGTVGKGGGRQEI